MLFGGRFQAQDYCRYFLHLFSVPSFIFSFEKRKGTYSSLPIKGKFELFIIFIHRSFTYGHSVQYQMLLVRLHVHTDLLKLKVTLTSPGFFFKEANLFYLVLETASISWQSCRSLLSPYTSAMG